MQENLHNAFDCIVLMYILFLMVFIFDGFTDHMKCDKKILAQILQFIYFGKSGDMIPSALTTEFGI